MTRAAIYSRISDDREGREVGVVTQEDDCRALAKRHGYKVLEVYRENDISASTRSRKPRPRYAEMLAAARAGEFDVILSYSNSRLTRRPLEVEDLITLHERYGTRIETVVSGNDDLSTADGRMTARIKGNVDTAEAERTAERTKRSKAQMAAEGKYRGGPRPYGYQKDGVTIREAEAAVLREATTALLSGRSLQSVARELNAAGKQAVRMKRPKVAPADQKLDPATGKPIVPPTKLAKVPWTAGVLRDVLLRPRNAGLLARGAVRSKELEIVGPAQWPAIVDRDTWDALRSMLTNPSRRTTTGNAWAWLGSGIYRCGVPVGDSVCGAVLRATATGQTAARPNHKRTGYYRCSAQAHLMINAEYTDDWVRRTVAELMRIDSVIEGLSPKAADLTPDRERWAVQSARLAQVERDYDDDLIDARRYAAKRDKINAEIAAIDAKLAEAVQRSTVSPILRAVDPGQAFLDAPLDMQRAVLAQVLKVEVLPRPEELRGTSWTSDRLRITRTINAEAS